MFDYEILQGEFLSSSVGESWEKLPYSKSKSTKSYTNKYLVFKGLFLLDGEVPSVFPQAWTLQGESEGMHIRCWVWGAGAPLLIIGKKKAEIWGTVILALCLFVPPGVKPSAQVPLVPAQRSMGYPCVLVEIDF